MKKPIALGLALCTMLSSAAMFGCNNKPAEVDPIDDNYRVFYQIFVGSFSDSDGDGTGDIRGIINRMDYLNDGNINSGKSLGVQGLWLSPIFESPSYHKYDAKDYYKIDPKFGTQDDLEELIEICHERNVKVILDLAINHTARTCDWFTQFTSARKKNDKSNEYYDYYTCVTSDERLNGHIYYQLYSGSTEYYEGNFDSGMPELNYDSQKVRDKMVDVAKHYLDIGIDGFRFDAIKYIYGGDKATDTQRSAEFWKWYMGELRKIKPDIYSVGECWSPDSEVLEYYPATNCFSFDTAKTAGGKIQDAVRGNVDLFAKYVQDFQKSAKEKNEDAMYIPFLTNHDQDRAAGLFPPEQKYDGVTSHPAQVAANLYLLCSGSPFIYYGEEIGMKGTRGSAQTDANRRLAMLWGDNDTVKDPIGATFKSELQINGTVKQQQKNKNSLLNYYAKVIAMRNKYPEIARGIYTAELPADRCGGFVIEYKGEKTILLHNVSTSSVKISVADLSVSVSAVADYIGLGKAKLSGGTLTIDGETSVILK